MVQSEAVLGPNVASDEWCAARRLFHHQKKYQNYTFRFPTVLGTDALEVSARSQQVDTAAVLEFHWSRFLRDFWNTPVWKRFVVDGDFVVGRDALVLNGLMWHLALDHERKFGMRSLTLEALFPQWRRELDQTVTRMLASPHAARLKQAVFWRTTTWREWPGAGNSYKPAFDNHHINHGNRYARARLRKAGFRVIETEKYSFHRTLSSTFEGPKSSYVLTKDSVHFPPPVSLAMFREIASVVHTETHALWEGPWGAALGGAPGADALRDPALAAFAALVNPAAGSTDGSGRGGDSEESPGEEEDDSGDTAAVDSRATPAPADAGSEGAGAGVLDDDGEPGSFPVSSLGNATGDGSAGALNNLLEAYGVWYGVSTVNCPTSESRAPGSFAAGSTAARAFSGSSRLLLLDETMLYAYLLAGVAIGAMSAAIALRLCGCPCAHPTRGGRGKAPTGPAWGGRFGGNGGHVRIPDSLHDGSSQPGGPGGSGTIAGLVSPGGGWGAGGVSGHEYEFGVDPRSDSESDTPTRRQPFR